MWIKEEAIHEWGQGVYRNSIPLHFAMNLNLLKKKKKVFLKNMPLFNKESSNQCYLVLSPVQCWGDGGTVHVLKEQPLGEHL